jgi:hypothetical protein
MEIQITTTINKIDAQGDIDLTFRYDIGLEFNNFLNFYIPTIETSFKSDNITMTFKLNFFSFNFGIDKFPEDPWNKFIEDEPQQSSSSNLKTSDTNNNVTINILEIISNIGDGMGHAAVVFIATACVIQGFKHDATGLTAFIVGIVVGVIEFIGWYMTTIPSETDVVRRKAALLGLGIGYLVSGVAALIAMVSLFSVSPTIFLSSSPIARLNGFFLFIDFILALVGIRISISELLQEVPDDDIPWLTIEAILSLSGGIIGLILGHSALKAMESKDLNPADVSHRLALFFIGIGLIVIISALNDNN